MKQKIFSFFLVVALCVSFVAATNYLVNPYSTTPSEVLDYKPYRETHQRVFKAQKLASEEYDVISLGNSRVGFGIFLNEYPLFMDKKTLNASAPGAGINEIYELLKIAIENEFTGTVLLGVSYDSFFGRDADKENIASILDHSFNSLTLTFSLDTFFDSVKTIARQFNKKKEVMDQHGNFNNETYQHGVILNGGHYQAFRGNGLFNFDYNTSISYLESYKNIIDLCHKNKVKLYQFIPPNHSLYMEKKIAKGSQERVNEYYKWLKDLVLINVETAIKYETNSFPLWDFFVYHELNNELIPKDKNAVMEFHFEDSHFKKSLGNIMLDRIFATNSYGGQNYPDFGVLMTSKNIDAHLQKLRKERAQWQAANQETVKLIQSLKN